MGKHIKKVAEILRRAKEKGHADSHPYSADYDEGTIRLYHYGTLIFKSQGSNLEELGGYSKSDADSIGTAMKVMGTKYSGVSQSDRYKDKPQMNGWYLL